MAVKHKSDSIQLIRDTEGIDNKDRVRILSPGSSPPKETTEVIEHALYMELENTPGDGEPYEYEFACASGRRFIPQRAGDANKLEGKTSAEVKALFADGRVVFAGSGTSVTLDTECDRVHSITVNGFTKQLGTGDASPVNVREILVGGMQANLFPGFTQLASRNLETGELQPNSNGNVSSDLFTCKANQDYYVSVKRDVISSLRVWFWDSDETFLQSISITSGATNPSGSFKSPTNAAKMAVSAYSSGGNLENYTEQLVAYGSKRVPYTKYTGSEYGVALEQHGTNILPKNASGASTQTGVTFTPNEDGTIYVKGTATADADYYTFGSYTSYDVKFVLAPGEYFLLSRTNSGVKNIASANTTAGAKFTVDEYTPITAFLVRAVNGRTVDGVIKPMLNVGGEALPYIQFAGFSRYPVPLTKPLCKEDTVITRIKSGCDKKVVFDGSDDETWELEASSTTGSTGSKRFYTRFDFSVENALSDAVGYGYSDQLINVTPRECYAASYGENTCAIQQSTSVGKGTAFVRIEGAGTEEQLRAKLAENPVTFFVKSTEYTERKDKPVCLEKHVRTRYVLPDKAPFMSASKVGANGVYLFLDDKNANTDNKIQADAICTHFKNNPYGFDVWTADGSVNKFFVGQSYCPRFVFGHSVIGTTQESTLDECKQAVWAYIEATRAAGKPIVLEYKLANPWVYAHDPVDFEFVAGEDGVFTITGEADGTLDVYYKALQDGGDADKLGGKLPEYYAAAANALGQYTHTKSGTVHELTGTGDNIRFVATADFAAGDTVKVNGTTCTASTMSGDALWAGFFKSGAVVVCYRTGNALNFSGGGLAAAEAAKITPENLKTGVSVTVNGKTVAGTFTADGTAAAGDMLLGKTGYVKGQKVTGTIPSKAAASYKPGTSAQTIKAVQYLSGDQTIEGDAALIAANIKYGASIFDVDGAFTSDANAVAAEILTGKIGYVKGQKITGSMPNQGAMWEKLSINGTVTIPAGYHNGQGKVTQSIPTKGAASYKPGTSAQTILSGQYLTGNQTIQGDGNLVAGNIRSGVSIFGVAGSFMEGSGGYLYMGQRNNTAMYGYAFGSASYSNGIRIGRSGNYLLVMFGYNETGYTGRMKVNGSDVFAYGLNPAAVHTTTRWLNAGDIVTISADEGVNYALTGFVYNT